MRKKTWENLGSVKLLCPVNVKEPIVCRCPVFHGSPSLRKLYKVSEPGPGKAIHGRTQRAVGHLLCWRSWGNGVVTKEGEREQQKAAACRPDLLHSHSEP